MAEVQHTPDAARVSGNLQLRKFDRFGRPIKHGLSRTPEHMAWRDMRQRCYNQRCQRYPNYGARGIRVCDRWRESFEAFLEDMGPRPGPGYSLDRIDVNGNYEPWNCRWATSDVQNSNRRDTRNLTFNGRTMSVSAWAREIGFNPRTLASRLDSGWSEKDALTIPPEPRTWRKVKVHTPSKGAVRANQRNR